MSNTLEIKFDDIVITNEHLSGYDRDRSINALWSAYDIIKKIRENSTSDQASVNIRELYMFCKFASFSNSDMTALVYEQGGGRSKMWFSPTFKRDLEKNGFVFSDYVWHDGIEPKKNPSLNQVKQFIMSYSDEDFDDVILGMKLFSDIRAKETNDANNSNIKTHGKPLTARQEQERTKPTPQDILASTSSLSDEVKRRILSFLEYCDANNIKYRWSKVNCWMLTFKSTSFGYLGVNIDKKSWSLNLNFRIFFQNENFFEFMKNENLTDFVYDNISYCIEECNGWKCLQSCAGGFRHDNPDDETLKKLQKIFDNTLEFEQNKPPLTFDLVIGYKKYLASDYMKFFQKECDFLLSTKESETLAWDVVRTSFRNREMALRELIDECWKG